MTTIAADPLHFPVLSIAPRPAPWRRWAAILAFVVIAPLAQAGTAEYTLLNTKLGGSKTIDRVSTATTSELVNALLAVISENPKVNAGTIAGEALKRAGTNAPDAGVNIANSVIAAYPNGLPLGTKTLSLPAFATQAIKTTATGVGLSVTQVPGFTGPFVSSDGDAVNLAITVKASTKAAGAVIQGRALELSNDTQKTALANSALGNTALATSVLDVAAGVSATVGDPVAFTNAVVTQPLNLKNVLKIVPGIAAGQPMSAGAVVEAAFTAFDSQGITSPLVKGAAALATSVGAVADIEQIQRVGTAIAKRVGTGTIKLASFTPITTALAKAIVAKPLAITGENRNANKVDELGELAAYTLGALVTNPDFVKAPEKSLAALVKALLTGAKSTYGPSQTDVASYVIGSIALTVTNLSNADPTRARLIAYLQLPATQKALAGASLTAIVAAAVTDGLAGTSGRFENGLDLSAGAMVDAETNSRNL